MRAFFMEFFRKRAADTAYPSSEKRMRARSRVIMGEENEVKHLPSY